MKTTIDNLMSVADYAKARNKSLSWAYKEIEKKKIKTIKIGKTLLVIVGKEKK